MALTEFQRQVDLSSLEGKSVEQIASLLDADARAVQEALEAAERWAREGHQD
jgi:hypothetical protein